MESEYNRSRDNRQENQQRQEQKKSEQSRQPETSNAAFVHASQLLQSGAKLRDLPPGEAFAVAEAVGNQTMLQLLRGGGAVPLAPAPPGRAGEAAEGLPEREADIRWPLLSVPPNFARDGPLPGQVFPINCLRPMGRRTETGVMPDG